MKILENGNKYAITKDDNYIHLYSYERELAKINIKKNTFKILKTDLSKTNIKHLDKFKKMFK